MCGIWGVFGFETVDPHLIGVALKIAHRGPDSFHLQTLSKMRNCALAFHHLEVMGGARDTQPLSVKQYPHITLLCNGEIYNFVKLRRVFQFEMETASDCEIIIHLYNKFGLEKTCSLLDGVFAMILVDTSKRMVMLGRDTYGIRPLFYFTSKTGQFGACSELKGMVDLLHSKNSKNSENGEGILVNVFPPASCAWFDVADDGRAILKELVRFHSFSDMPAHWIYQGIKLSHDNDFGAIKENIRTLFINAVEKRMMSNRKIGSMLSGGLDSSLVAAVVAKKLRNDNCKAPLSTFSIGMEATSPDLISARKVAAHIGSNHHEVCVSTEEALQIVVEVIHAVESYDTAVIRAATPMYLLAKYISNETDTIVVLSGEGADELAQGYIYYHKQPTPLDGDKDSRRLLKDIHYFDVLRTDRCTAAHGLEVRTPFLDHSFTSYFLSLPAEMRSPQNNVEKHLIRSSFDGTGLLPDSVLWRGKEGFSDGVATQKNSWYKVLKENIKNQVSDEQLFEAGDIFSHNTPLTKEAYYYRSVFERRFGSKQSKLLPYLWVPRWVGESVDPGARALPYYTNDEDKPTEKTEQRSQITN